MTREDILKQISSQMQAYLDSKKFPTYGLLGGDMGIVYLFFKFSKILDTDLDPDKYLDKILNSLRANPIVYSYCNGLSGLGYSLYKLQQEGFVSNIDSSLVNFDTELSSWFCYSLYHRNIDPLHGALGALYYFSIRSNFNNKICVDILKLWSKYLKDNLEKVTNGHTIGFRTFDRTPPYNLSLSHGLSGLIVITIEALKNIRIDDDKEIITTLEVLGKYLITKIRLNSAVISCTPNFDTSDGSIHQSRLAWCYGDLGVALALYKIGWLTGNSIYIDASKIIIEHASLRRSPQETVIMDRCICHGSCGVYMMFKYFNEFLFDGGLTEVVKYWYDFTYKDVLDGTHSYLERFLFFNNENSKYELRSNILDGMSGLGLGLMTEDILINNLLFLT